MLSIGLGRSAFGFLILYSLVFWLSWSPFKKLGLSLAIILLVGMVLNLYPNKTKRLSVPNFYSLMLIPFFGIQPLASGTRKLLYEHFLAEISSPQKLVKTLRLFPGEETRTIVDFALISNGKIASVVRYPGQPDKYYLALSSVRGTVEKIKSLDFTNRINPNDIKVHEVSPNLLAVEGYSNEIHFFSLLGLEKTGSLNVASEGRFEFDQDSSVYFLANPNFERPTNNGIFYLGKTTDFFQTDRQIQLDKLPSKDILIRYHDFFSSERDYLAALVLSKNEIWLSVDKPERTLILKSTANRYIVDSELPESIFSENLKFSESFVPFTSFSYPFVVSAPSFANTWDEGWKVYNLKTRQRASAIEKQLKQLETRIDSPDNLKRQQKNMILKLVLTENATRTLASIRERGDKKGPSFFIDAALDGTNIERFKYNNESNQPD